jgi:L-ribulokinase
MTKVRATIGVDFGTESARAVLIDVSNGRELATSVHRYESGVIDEHLPGDETRLPLDWALQDPADYVTALGSTVQAVIGEGGLDSNQIIGVGIDFTSCTMLPVLNDGTPLCQQPELRAEPHAWVKLWKHHAAQPEADLINDTARKEGSSWLRRYGGKTSSEWFFAKSLQILDEAPDIYRRADRLIEAADWSVWQLTGVETRNSCTAGYKALWSKKNGFPDQRFFGDLAPGFGGVVDDKMSRQISPLGGRAGEVTTDAASWTGLSPGTPVAVANVDAHVSVPAVTVVGPGSLVAVMGTSTCHMALGSTEREIPGFCGVVEDGIIPGFFGYEAGQAAVGDMFAWFTTLLSNPLPTDPTLAGQAAVPDSTSVHRVLEEDARRLRPGESGLVALDWWNGNRSVLVDADLTGLLLGATLATTPSDIYRALLESTAFGTRVIIESLDQAGIPVNEVIACGGLPFQNRLLMQLTADITGRPVRVASSRQAPALGSAMFAAVAAGPGAGGYESIVEASQQMTRPSMEEFLPDEANASVYDELFQVYRELHDSLAADDSPMRRLRTLQQTADDGATR